MVLRGRGGVGGCVSGSMIRGLGQGGSGGPFSGGLD